MKGLRRIPLLFLPLLVTACQAGPAVRTGADVLLERRLDLLRGRRVGLITNPSGALASGGRLLDSLIALGVDVTALFSPEHGIGGTAAAGEKVDDGRDPPTGITVFSLYGKTTRPTAAMLRNVDVLIYHLQDAGVRFYTYVSTMKAAMEAAAEAAVPFIVLDRPNPLGGLIMDGPVMEDSLRSFVGAIPVPVMYGLTCGELARMINDEGWLEGGARVHLTVVPMEGWTRGMQWDDTGLPWIPPSPNITSSTAALLYPGTCLLEATNVSEGRGTTGPFQMLGAPFVDGLRLAEEVRGFALPGFDVLPARFTPSSSKYAGRECQGIRIVVTDPGKTNSLMAGLVVFHALVRLHPDSLRVDRRWLAALLGSGRIADLLSAGISPEQLPPLWSADLESYRRTASRYRLYGD